MEVTEGAVDMVLKADLVIRGPMRWETRDPANRRVRCELPVASSLGESLTFHLHIAVRMPWQYTFCLVWRSEPIRRLDVRGSHRNTCDGSGETWTNETHKHVWRNAYRDAWAYTPSGLPKTPGLKTAEDEYRRVFEAFCEECNVRVDTDWVDPDLTGPLQDTFDRGTR
jgi:hypothetical protein